MYIPSSTPLKIVAFEDNSRYILVMFNKHAKCPQLIVAPPYSGKSKPENWKQFGFDRHLDVEAELNRTVGSQLHTDEYEEALTTLIKSKLNLAKPVITDCLDRRIFTTECSTLLIIPKDILKLVFRLKEESFYYAAIERVLSWQDDALRLIFAQSIKANKLPLVSSILSSIPSMEK